MTYALRERCQAGVGKGENEIPEALGQAPSVLPLPLTLLTHTSRCPMLASLGALKTPSGAGATGG